MKFFSENPEEKNAIFKQKKDDYLQWRNELQRINKPFFLLPTDFKYNFLRELSGGALKLYIFLGFHSKYQTGESWYTLEQVASFFHKDKRTVAGWFQELEKHGLIFKAQKGFMMKANTFLRPFGFHFDEINENEVSNVDHVLLDLDSSKDLGFKPILGLIMSYNLEEYTFLLVYEDRAQYPCSCFYNFDSNQIKRLRAKLKSTNIRIDNYDLAIPLKQSKNKAQDLYKYLLGYLDEQNM